MRRNPNDCPAPKCKGKLRFVERKPLGGVVKVLLVCSKCGTRSHRWEDS